MANAKTPTGDDEWTDFSGTLPIPQVHDVFYRKGRAWIVIRVVARTGKAVPVYNIFLTEYFEEPTNGELTYWSRGGVRC